MEIVKIIKVDRETQKVITEFVSFCIKNNINIEDFITSIATEYPQASINHHAIDIIFE